MSEEKATTWSLWLLGFFALAVMGGVTAWMSRVVVNIDQARTDIVILQRDMDVVKQRFSSIDGKLGEIQINVNKVLHELIVNKKEKG